MTRLHLGCRARSARIPGSATQSHRIPSSLALYTNSYALLIENKGSGMSLIQDLKSEGIRAIAVEADGDKIMRMNAHTARN